MRSRPTATSVAALALLAGLALGGCSGDDSVGEVPPPASTPSSGSGTPSDTSEPSPSPAPRDTAVPRLAVEVVAEGFEHGWDIGFLPDGKALVTERPGRISLVSGLREGARRTTVRADLEDLFVASEGGLMGMVVHPDFVTSREFTTCQTHQEGGAAKDIRLVTWRLSVDEQSAERVKTLLSGLPISSGRHSGCRPELETGQPLPDNPFASSSNRRERYVLSYGHRNVQGVAVQPGTGVVYTAEHGPSFNDEVNRIRAGANYGWDPSQGGTVGGYDESVPMTDRTRFPDAVPAIWQSGKTTQAVCAAEFLEGSQWGGLEGALVVTALKGAKLLLLTLAPDGTLAKVAVPKATNGPYGRLRAARMGPDGALYVTTTNGDDDKLLRISPKP